MDTSVKLAAAAIGLFLAAANCNAQTRAGDAIKISEDVTYSKKTLLKNWALCSCLLQITKNKGDYNGIVITPGTYFEYGKQPFEACNTLGGFAKKYTKRKYSGAIISIKSGFNTMKCMDMYYSKKLDWLVIKLLKTSYKY